MNEILAPLYYIFKNDPHPLFSDSFESDAFFCFTMLMGELKDAFIRSLDESESGIKARVMGLNLMLKTVDKSLW